MNAKYIANSINNAMNELGIVMHSFSDRNINDIAEYVAGDIENESLLYPTPNRMDDIKKEYNQEKSKLNHDQQMEVLEYKYEIKELQYQISKLNNRISDLEKKK
jgi:predicted  nucleic acid-binding Zn-ribbon protein